MRLVKLGPPQKNTARRERGMIFPVTLRNLLKIPRPAALKFRNESIPEHDFLSGRVKEIWQRNENKLIFMKFPEKRPPTQP